MKTDEERLKRLRKLRELRQLVKSNFDVHLDCYSLTGTGLATVNCTCEGAFNLTEELSEVDSLKVAKLLGEYYHSHNSMRYSSDGKWFTRFKLKNLS